MDLDPELSLKCLKLSPWKLHISPIVGPEQIPRHPSLLFCKIKELATYSSQKLIT